MSFVMYVPGLMGDRQIERLNQNPTQADDEMRPGTYARSVQNTARRHGLDFFLAVYQSQDNPYPTLSQMGGTVAGEYLARTDELEPGQPRPLAFGSSFGAAVLVEALHHLHAQRTRPPRFPHVVLFDGVYDPLAAIAAKAEADPKARAAVKALMTATAEHEADLAYHMPVEPGPTEPNPGVFLLSPRHVREMQAKRILADGADQPAFGISMNPHIPSLLLLSTGRHAVSPPGQAQAFARRMGANAQIDIWERETGRDYCVVLEDKLGCHLSVLEL